MRKGTYNRKTKETDVRVVLNLDGHGNAKIHTPIGFLNHMLELFSFFSGIDLELTANGDIHVDYHHIVEDIGICIGEAISVSLKDKAGISRFGQAITPMDESLTQVIVDISGRPFLVYKAVPLPEKIGEMDSQLIEEFFHALSYHANITLHINMYYGDNGHHIIESCFKGFGRAMKEAVRMTQSSIPSTKGVI